MYIYKATRYIVYTAPFIGVNYAGYHNLVVGVDTMFKAELVVT